MRDWLQAGADIPDEPEIDVDLTGPDYFFSPKGQIQLEPQGRDEGSRFGFARHWRLPGDVAQRQNRSAQACSEAGMYLSLPFGCCPLDAL
jgi:hypothetical protein